MAADKYVLNYPRFRQNLRNWRKTLLKDKLTASPQTRVFINNQPPVTDNQVIPQWYTVTGLVA
ncbi:MAG: hypothetical protein ABJR23_04740, partial [Paracoccaceae bacterium]